ncbi:MAG: hypothetical protein WC505_04250 [Patescibacteria group bacterium]
MAKYYLTISVTLCIALFAAGMLLLPAVAMGQDDGGDDSTSSVKLPNILGKNMDLISIMIRAMQLCLACVDIFALFMFILGGFEFLISAGNPTLIKKAKDTLVWATLGILVITLSYSVLKFVFEGVIRGIAS